MFIYFIHQIQYFYIEISKCLITNLSDVSTLVCLPPKVVFHRSRLPPKDVFYQRSSSTEGRLPPKVDFHQLFVVMEKQNWTDHIPLVG